MMGSSGAESAGEVSDDVLSTRTGAENQGAGGAGGTQGFGIGEVERPTDGLGRALAPQASAVPGAAPHLQDPVQGAATGSVPAAGSPAISEEQEQASAFLAAVLKASAEDKRRTLVFSAPVELVGSDESLALLNARTRYVYRVLQLEAFSAMRGACEVKAEYVISLPGWRAGRGGVAPERVTVNFLHVEFAQAEQAEALKALFDKRCPGPEGGLPMQWEEEVLQVRIAMEGNAEWVLGQSTGVAGRVELTTHPVWRAGVYGIGFAPTRRELVQQFGGHAVRAIMKKFVEWGVDADMRYVAIRPILQSGSEVVKGLMLVVEVVKAPWVLPTGVVAVEGLPLTHLEWAVAGPRRHPWTGSGAPVMRLPSAGWGGWGGGAGAFGPAGPGGKGQGPSSGGAMGGWGPGVCAGLGPGGGVPLLPGAAGPGSSAGQMPWGKGAGGGGGKGHGKGGKGWEPHLVHELHEWQDFVLKMYGDSGTRRDVLTGCWGPHFCPRAVYFSLQRDRIAPCRGRCKTERALGQPVTPCSVASAGLSRLVPPQLRAEVGGSAGPEGDPLFGGPCRGLPTPPWYDKPQGGRSQGGQPAGGGGRARRPGQGAAAQRVLDRWQAGKGPQLVRQDAVEGASGSSSCSVWERLAARPEPRAQAGGQARGEPEGSGSDAEMGEAGEEGDALGLPDAPIGGDLGVLLGEVGEAGGDRRRGRDQGPDSSDEDELAPAKKVLRSPAREE